MSISIGSDSFNSITANMASDKVKTDNLKKKLTDNAATDEELMEVCKSFETYMIEQVMKEMKKSVSSEEEDNDYLKQFGDILYEEYAKNATENESLGIAQMLYESMKRNA
ncbi:MAG TPA: rod-binding protein [Mobilitalea sp.]|nr:rod-binding protein [Mobilitalea sp.]